MEARELFDRYLQRELNYALKKFGLDVSLRWREQMLEQKENIIKAIEKDLAKGAYVGYYRRKKP